MNLKDDINKLLNLLDTYRVITEDGHWLWIGGKNSDGYGVMNSSDRTTSHVVHRLMLIAQHKLDPHSNLLALHKLNCDKKNCFNPEHLYIGTHRDNMQDVLRARHNARSNKTHCARGHEFTEDNTYRGILNKRACRKCRNRSSKESQRKRKAQNAL